MKVAELKKILERIPDNVLVSFAPDGYSPYDDWWECGKCIRITDITTGEFDRICLISD